MKRRRNKRSRVWLVLVVALVAIALVVGVGVYGGAMGIHLSSSEPSTPFSVSNVTLTSLPSIEDGDAGMRASADIANHGSAKIENTTMTVNTVPMGTCTTVILPGSQTLCTFGQDLSCDNYPAAPYAIKVTVDFLGGATYSSTTQITSTLTVPC
jgi:hypothetical protein